jgi:hypothetical protein
MSTNDKQQAQKRKAPSKDVADDVTASLMQHHLAYAAAAEDVDQEVNTQAIMINAVFAYFCTYNYLAPNMKKTDS